MAKKKAAQVDECVATFEESLETLEAIVDALEGGKLGLSEALDRYEEGVRHLKSCQQLLERAERKIELLSGVDANGNAITAPYDDEELASLDEKAAARGRRRTGEARRTSAAGGGDIDEVPRLF